VLKGLFKQYGAIFILGTERDLFKLRTNYRHEQLYLYPTNSTPQEVRTLFIYMLKRCNRLRKHPQFYNTITHNCLTSLLPIFDKVKPPRDKFDIRLYLNGFTDQLAFETGWLKRKPGEKFIDYKAEHLTNLYVQHLKETPDYSKLIRPKGIFE
jgi:hypothetical protein